MAQGRALAGGADRHDAVRPLADLPVDEVAERLLVERAVLTHGGDEGDEGSLEHASPYRALPRAHGSDGAFKALS